MICAFFGVVGREPATEAALLLAHALAEEPVALVRVLYPSDMLLPGAKLPPAIGLTEVFCRSVPEASVLVHEAVARALGKRRAVVLDLPGDCMGDQAVRDRIDLAVVPVGPSPIAERAAAAALGDHRFVTTAERAAVGGAPLPGAPSPPWLLACGRAGGAPAALAFRRGAARIAGRLKTPAPRTFPLALPPLIGTDALGLLGDQPSPRAMRSARALLLAVQQIRRKPGADSTEVDAAFAALDQGDANRDERGVADRLADLAEAMRAIEAGHEPTPDDLADAPILDDWSPAVRATTVLTGNVRRHPNFPSRRRIRTSDVYATDNRTWAQCFSRPYRLGTPAGRAGKKTGH